MIRKHLITCSFALLCQGPLLLSQTLTMVKDIIPGSGSSDIKEVTISSGRLNFTTLSETSWRMLWTSTGTSTSTELIQSLNPHHLMSMSGRLVYIAVNGGFNGLFGEFIWNIPSTTPTEKFLAPHVPYNYIQTIPVAFATASLVYYSMNDGVNGHELYLLRRSSALSNAVGSAPPVQSSDGWDYMGMVRDMNPGLGGSDPANFTELNGKVYFAANNGTAGRELWVTNGTSTGTTMVMDINPGANSSNISPFVAMGGMLYFTAHTEFSGRELWRTDGTTAGTIQVRNINTKQPNGLVSPTAPSSGSNPANLFAWNNKLYFSANNGSNGSELWSSDGTAAGTVLLKDINPTVNSDPKCFSGYAVKGLVNGVSVNKNYLAFAANDGVNGEELWRTDGTAAGTLLLKDVKAGVQGSSPTELVSLTTTAGLWDGTYYYSAIGGANGRELWEFKATTGAHRKISPAVAPNRDPLAQATNFPWVVLNNAMYFYANYDSNGGELWKLTR